jgi:heme exporter protein A
MLPGSLLYLMGPNGVGKTTLLRIIATLNLPAAGDITFRGQSLKAFEHPPVNYIGHTLGIKAELTVMENILYWARSLEAELALQAAIAYLGLESFLEHKCSELSSGERKKVALSRLLLSRAPIWLLDEIETNLDDNNLGLLHHLINAKISAGGLVLISSHIAPKNPKCQILNLKDYQS